MWDRVGRPCPWWSRSWPRRRTGSLRKTTWVSDSAPTEAPRSGWRVQPAAVWCNVRAASDFDIFVADVAAAGRVFTGVKEEANVAVFYVRTWATLSTLWKFPSMERRLFSRYSSLSSTVFTLHQQYGSIPNVRHRFIVEFCVWLQLRVTLIILREVGLLLCFSGTHSGHFLSLAESQNQCWVWSSTQSHSLHWLHCCVVCGPDHAIGWRTKQH